MVTVSITKVTAPAELFHWYDREHQPQGCQLTLDLETGEMTAGFDPASKEAASPPEIAYGYLRRWDIPMLTAEGANRLMAEVKPLAQRVCDDWHEETDWQHNGWVVLGADAEAATQAIDEACRSWDEEEKYLIAVHGVVGLEADGYKITATTTDEQLEQYADELTAEAAEAAPSGVAVYPGLLDYYIQLRNERREEP